MNKVYHQNIFKYAAVLFPLLLVTTANAQFNLQSEVDAYLSNLPFKMNTIKLPEFQNKEFNVEKFGAIGDGHTLNTKAIQTAIEKCSEAGGGTVVIPKGLWLTAPIELKNNVNLHLNRGALVTFSPDHSLYPIIKPPHRGYEVMSPIYGANLKNVAVTGEGILDGAGKTWRPVKKEKTTASQWKKLLKSGGTLNEKGSIWWPSKEALEGSEYIKSIRRSGKKLTAEDYIPARDYMRPYMLLLVNCSSVFIEGVTIKNSPKFAMYPTLCKDLIIRDVKVNNEWWAQNGDGIDINTCKNVLVYKCTVNAGDDGICMKSNDYENSKEAGLRNIVIRDNIVYHGHGGFVIGSDTDGGINNIYVENCNFIRTDIGLRFKSARDRGGLVQNVFIKNIYMKDIAREAVLFNTYYEIGKGDNRPYPVTGTTPIFENFQIDSVYCVGASRAVSIAGLPEMPIKDIKFSNLYIEADRGFESMYADSISLKNVSIIPKSGEVYNLSDTKNFTLENGTCPSGTNVFMKLKGKSTKGIKIVNTDISGAQTPVDYGTDVTRKVEIVK